MFFAGCYSRWVRYSRCLVETRTSLTFSDPSLLSSGSHRASRKMQKDAWVRELQMEYKAIPLKIVVIMVLRKAV